MKATKWFRASAGCLAAAFLVVSSIGCNPAATTTSTPKEKKENKQTDDKKGEPIKAPKPDPGD
jgi:hypothetical protein